MPRSVFRVDSFAGGRDTLTSRGTTPPYRSPDDLNCSVNSPRALTRRGGYQQWLMYVFAGTGPGQGLFRYVQKDGDRYVMAAANGVVVAAKGDGPHYSDYIEVTNGLATTGKIRFAQMNEWCFMTDYTHNVRRWNGSASCDAYPALPATSPFVDGTPASTNGYMEMRSTASSAADPDYVYGLAMQYGGLGESARYNVYGLSPGGAGYGDSNNLVTLTGFQAAFTELRTRGVTGVRIYRSLYDPNTSNGPASVSLLYIGQALDVGTVNYVDDDNDSVLFEPAPDEPKAYGIRCKFLEVHNQRLWYGNCQEPEQATVQATYPDRVYYSEAFRSIQVTEDAYEVFDEGDGSEITGLKSFREELVVFKNSKMFVLSGVSPEDFVIRKVDAKVGCVAGDTIVVCGDGYLRWLSREGVMRYDGGGQPVKESRLIDPDLKAALLEDGRLELCCAAWHEDQYILSVPKPE